MAKSDDTTSYEPAGIERPWIIISCVLGMLVLTMVAMGAIYLFYRPAAREGPIAVSRFSAPRLQTDPSKDLAKLKRRQNVRLNSVEWLDGNRTHLSIPIAAAMKAIAARGSEAFDPLPNAAAKEANGQDRPAGAVAPAHRRDNPGAGAPRMMETPQ